MWRRTISATAAVALLGLGGTTAHAASASKTNAGMNAALKKLYASNPSAKIVGDNANGILVFPSSSTRRA